MSEDPRVSHTHDPYVSRVYSLHTGDPATVACRGCKQTWTIAY